jgi:hypothetical protein
MNSKNVLKVVVSFLPLALVACGGATTTSDAGTSGGNYWSVGSGTVSGDGVSATVSGVEVFFQQSPGETTSDLELAATFDSTSGGDLTFTTPTGITTGGLTCVVQLEAAPTVATFASATGCGGLAFDYATSSTSDGFASQAPAVSWCSNSANQLASGSWTLTITSLTLAVQGTSLTSTLWTPHGTLTSTLPDAANGSVTLDLSF